MSCETDGCTTPSTLVQDPAGNLYGTAAGGGAYGYGTVYKLAPNPNGSWTLSVVYAFAGSDGAYPLAGVVLDTAGNLYGVTGGGGAYGHGTVYEITP